MKRTIPTPSKRGGEMAYSGQFLMRVPKRLHSEMAKAAKAQGVSLNQYVLYLLTSRHVERKSGIVSPLWRAEGTDSFTDSVVSRARRATLENGHRYCAQSV